MGCTNHLSHHLQGPWRGLLPLLLLVSLVAAAPRTTWAQEATVVEEETEAVEEAADAAAPAETPEQETATAEVAEEAATVAEAEDPMVALRTEVKVWADTLWVLIAGMLVFFMNLG